MSRAFIYIKTIVCLALVLTLFFPFAELGAETKGKLHPMNRKLIKAGIMKNVPKYYPQIPRLTAGQALSLYGSNKALFLFVAYKNLHLIRGAIHMTEGKAHKINPNRLPFKKGQVLVVYCA